MSVYLYTFDTKPKRISGSDVYHLAFKCGHAHEGGRFIDSAYRRFEGRELPEFYVHEWEEGGLVYRTDTIQVPYWIDTDAQPGHVIGSLRKKGRSWVIEERFDVIRLEGEYRPGGLAGRILDLTNATSWPVTGYGSLDFEAAERACAALHRAKHDDDPYSYEIRPMA